MLPRGDFRTGCHRGQGEGFHHAAHLANASPYGLSSAIYTNDRLEAYRYKTGIKAGMTGINNSTTGAEAHLPFGGVKGSGNGTRESGIWVIEAYSYWHAVNDELSGNPTRKWTLMKSKWLRRKSIGRNWPENLSKTACGSMVNLKDPALLG